MTAAAKLINLDEIPSPTPKVKKPIPWMRGLSKDDEKILLQNGWLNDKIVNVGQQLIQARFPNVSGLQDPSLGPSMFKKVNLYKFCTLAKVTWLLFQQWGASVDVWTYTTVCLLQ